MRLAHSFPNLETHGYRVASPQAIEYNCIAWAAGDDSRWWWPDDNAYWPTSDRAVGVEAFLKAFAALGYTIADSDALEDGYERVALYARDDRVTHAARQLRSGQWTSQLGSDVDIEHTLPGLEGPLYGRVVLILRRRTPSVT
jgi:hypothetical protein